MRRLVDHGFICSVCLALTLGAMGCSKSSRRMGQNEYEAMSNRLTQARIALERGNILPISLAELGATVNSSLFSSVDSNLFVCPGNEGQAGPLSQIQDWTDYIYVGNPVADALIDVALIISPPENHGGDHGYVVFSTGELRRMPAERVRELIADPFCMATNESPQNIANARKRTVVNIPNRLQPFYPPGSFFENVGPNGN